MDLTPQGVRHEKGKWFFRSRAHTRNHIISTLTQPVPEEQAAAADKGLAAVVFLC